MPPKKRRRRAQKKGGRKRKIGTRLPRTVKYNSGSHKSTIPRGCPESSGRKEMSSCSKGGSSSDDNVVSPINEGEYRRTWHYKGHRERNSGLPISERFPLRASSNITLLKGKESQEKSPERVRKGSLKTWRERMDKPCQVDIG